MGWYLEIIKTYLICIEAFFIRILKKTADDFRFDKPNIIIIGGGLSNKGAQAMTFTVVDQFAKMYPKKKCFLFSAETFKKFGYEKNKYTFDIFPWDKHMRFRLICPLNRLIAEGEYTEYEKKAASIIKNAGCFIDISGYALSSQFQPAMSLNYLMNIIIAYRYSVPYYIMPQSIGPFDYPKAFKRGLLYLIKLLLKYPAKTFVREKNGLTCLVEHSIQANSDLCVDLVLQNTSYEVRTIFSSEEKLKKIPVGKNSVGIIPNVNVAHYLNEKNFLEIYKSLIDCLLAHNKKVYIFRHSTEDLPLCDKIKNIFPTNQNVYLITDDLNAIELEYIIKQCDFLIASRYHAIVHSLKNRVPVFVIGWAVKYYELLENFGFLQYFFDCRNQLDLSKMKESLEKLITSADEETKRIAVLLKEIQNNNIFHIFEKKK